MKKNAGKITIALLLMACMIIVYMITPAFSIVRSYDQDVRTVSMTTVMSAGADQMFTVAGGRIEIISMFGECTTVISNTPGSITIWLDANNANYDKDFSTTVDANTLGVGDVIRFSNAMDEGVTDLTANVGAGQTLSWFCSTGEIEQKLSQTGAGKIKWYMSYRRLDSEAVVTAN